MSRQLIAPMVETRELWSALYQEDFTKAFALLNEHWDAEGPIPDIVTPITYYVSTLRNESVHPLTARLQFLNKLVDLGAEIHVETVNAAIQLAEVKIKYDRKVT